ncbi:MAG: universal stress protein [Akkermansiaceae bacterium]|nr:universal stress protein [Akkermansiaceae bacterium]
MLEELAKHDESHARVARLRGKAILQDAVKQLAGHEVKTTQRHGSVVETLDEFEKGAELVVIGKRGEHADFAKGHLGSNLERVIRSARIPVLVAARECKPIRSFLLAFDGGRELSLGHAATGLRGAGFTVKADLSPGDPDEVITAEVGKRDIGLLVMGAYGHSRVRQLILGSTTTHLIRTCHVPVMLFR